MGVVMVGLWANPTKPVPRLFGHSDYSWYIFLCYGLTFIVFYGVAKLLASWVEYVATDDELRLRFTLFHRVRLFDASYWWYEVDLMSTKRNGAFIKTRVNRWFVPLSSPAYRAVVKCACPARSKTIGVEHG
jgi:hypothetical protein